MPGRWFRFLSIGAVAACVTALQRADASCDPSQWQGPTDGVYNISTSTEAGKLNIHLIPHTHIDAGWQRTFNQYFVHEVHAIADLVVDELLKDERRKFMFAEQGFFQRWWQLQGSKMRATVKKLVKEGRLDLSVHGAWVMHDEATCHYTAMIDQTALGHEYIYRDFGVVPRIGWQIDPFGHSATQGAVLASGMGYDALYFSRMDDQEYVMRRKKYALEWVWRPSVSRGRNAQVFTGDIQRDYLAPRSLHFRKGAFVDDDPNSEEFNVCEMVNRFMRETKGRMKYQRGEHIFFPMGDDFAYQNARAWFTGMDKLIHYVNQKGHVHVLYSTLGYYTAKKQEEGLKYSVRRGDLFPYANTRNGYWTGYYTSRPTLKRLVRTSNVLLQQLRQMEMANLASSSGVDHLRREVAMLQHHDGVTGTEKAHVAHDYTKRLYDATMDAQRYMNEKLLTQWGSHEQPFELCMLLNISHCEVTQNHESVDVFVYNPLPRTQLLTVTVPSNQPGGQVSGRNSGVSLPCGVFETTKAYDGNMGEAPYEVIFKASLPPFGKQIYHIKTMPNNANKASNDKLDTDVIILENDAVRVEFSRDRASPVALENKKKKIRLPLHVSAQYYEGSQKGQASGAYIFFPAHAEKKVIKPESILRVQRVGKLTQRLTVSLGSWGTLEYQINEGDSNLQLQWTIGPIDVSDKQGKEVVLVFDTGDNLKSRGTWYTDSNGLEFIKRKRDHRIDYKLVTHSDEERVAANYYPITTGVFMKDDEYQLNVITDRAQGVSSMQDGQLEVMIHRRLLMDDKRAVHEPLSENETVVIDGQNVQEGIRVRGHFLVNLDSPDSAMEGMRKAMERSFYEPLIAFRSQHRKSSHTIRSVRDVPMLHFKEFPENIGLATVQVHNDHCFLVRLVHLFAIHEHPQLSKPVTFVFEQFISHSKGLPMTVDEMMLSGVRSIREDQHKPLQWNLENDDRSNVDKGTGESIALNGTRVVLQAMEVRAFRLCFPLQPSNDTAANVEGPLDGAPGQTANLTKELWNIKTPGSVVVNVLGVVLIVALVVVARRRRRSTPNSHEAVPLGEVAEDASETGSPPHARRSGAQEFSSAMGSEARSPL